MGSVRIILASQSPRRHIINLLFEDIDTEIREDV